MSDENIARFFLFAQAPSGASSSARRPLTVDGAGAVDVVESAEEVTLFLVENGKITKAQGDVGVVGSEGLLQIAWARLNSGSASA